MKPWSLVGLLAATATASYLARVNVSVAGVLRRNELALDPIQMGRVFSAFLLGCAGGRRRSPLARHLAAAGGGLTRPTTESGTDPVGGP